MKRKLQIRRLTPKKYRKGLTVQKSLSLVPGAPSAPVVKAGTKSLLDPSVKPSRSISVPAKAPVGTKSLLDMDD